MRESPILLFSLWVLSGCELLTHPSAELRRVEFSTLAQGSHIVADKYGPGGYTRHVPELVLFNSVADVQRFAERKEPQNTMLDSLARIDYDTYSVILLQWESQSTGRIQIAIDSILQDRRTLQVYATLLLPDAWSATCDIGFPCHIVATPKVAGSPELSRVDSCTVPSIVVEETHP